MPHLDLVYLPLGEYGLTNFLVQWHRSQENRSTSDSMLATTTTPPFTSEQSLFIISAENVISEELFTP